MATHQVNGSVFTQPWGNSLQLCKSFQDCVRNVTTPLRAQCSFHDEANHSLFYCSCRIIGRGGYNCDEPTSLSSLVFVTDMCVTMPVFILSSCMFYWLVRDFMKLASIQDTSTTREQAATKFRLCLSAMAILGMLFWHMYSVLLVMPSLPDELIIVQTALVFPLSSTPVFVLGVLLFSSLRSAIRGVPRQKHVLAHKSGRLLTMLVFLACFVAQTVLLLRHNLLVNLVIFIPLLFVLVGYCQYYFCGEKVPKEAADTQVVKEFSQASSQFVAFQFGVLVTVLIYAYLDSHPVIHVVPSMAMLSGILLKFAINLSHFACLLFMTRNTTVQQNSNPRRSLHGGRNLSGISLDELDIESDGCTPGLRHVEMGNCDTVINSNDQVVAV